MMLTAWAFLLAFFGGWMACLVNRTSKALGQSHTYQWVFPFIFSIPTIVLFVLLMTVAGVKP